MAEKKVIEIDIESNLGSLKSQLKEAQAEVVKLSDTFGATSKEAAEAAKKAADLKDRIGDAKALTDAFNPDAKFKALSSSIGGVLNGFQAYEGALGLIGVENEDLQKTLLKVQSAMALSQGIQGIGEAKDSFVQLGSVIKNTAVGQGILTAATSVFTFVTSAATTGLKLFRIALVSTGIGAIVVLVGLLIANFDKITSVLIKLSGYVIKAYDYFDNLGTGIKVLIGIFFPLIGVIYGAIKALEYFNIIDTKNEREMSARHEANMKRIDKELAKREKQKQARKKQYEDEDKALGRQIALLDAQGKSSDALVEKRIKNSIAYQKSLLKELEINERILKATNAMGINDELITQTQKAITETTNAILDAENQLDINQADINKERADKAKENADKKLNAEQEYNNKLREFQDAIEAERQAKIKDAKEKELQDLDNKYEQLYAKADAAGQSDKELIEKQQAEITAINEKYAILGNQKRIELEDKQFEAMQSIGQTAKEKEISDLVKSYEDKFAIVGDNDELEKELTAQQKIDLGIIEDKYRKEQAEKDKETAEKKIAIENNIKQTKLKLAGEAFGAIGDLIQSFNAKDEASARKQFKVAKAFNLSAALVNTALAVSSALALRPDQSVFPGQRFVEAGIAGVTGLASVAKIASTQFGSGAGGGGGDTPNPTAGFNPSFNVVGNSGINQLAGIQQQPVKAYITTGEVSTALSLERNTLQKTTF